MGMINGCDIAEMAERCIGHINAIGETNYDNVSLENLKKHLEVIDILLDDVQLLIPNTDSCAYSVKEIGACAVKYLFSLQDSIKDWLKGGEME